FSPCSTGTPPITGPWYSLSSASVPAALRMGSPASWNCSPSNSCTRFCSFRHSCMPRTLRGGVEPMSALDICSGPRSLPCCSRSSRRPLPGPLTETGSGLASSASPLCSEPCGIVVLLFWQRQVRDLVPLPVQFHGRALRTFRILKLESLSPETNCVRLRPEDSDHPGSRHRHPAAAPHLHPA